MDIIVSLFLSSSDFILPLKASRKDYVNFQIKKLLCPPNSPLWSKMSKLSAYTRKEILSTQCLGVKLVFWSLWNDNRGECVRRKYQIQFHLFDLHLPHKIEFWCEPKNPQKAEETEWSETCFSETSASRNHCSEHLWAAEEPHFQLKRAWHISRSHSYWRL